VAAATRAQIKAAHPADFLIRQNQSPLQKMTYKFTLSDTDSVPMM
jgi:hypothetical protein